MTINSALYKKWVKLFFVEFTGAAVAFFFMRIFRYHTFPFLFFISGKFWHDTIKKGTFAITKEIATLIYVKIPFLASIKKDKPVLFTLLLTPCSFFLLHLILCPIFSLKKYEEVREVFATGNIKFIIYALYCNLLLNYCKGFIFNVSKKTFGTFYTNYVNKLVDDKYIRIFFNVILQLCYIPAAAMLSYPSGVIHYNQTIPQCWTFAYYQGIKHIPLTITIELLKMKVGL